MTTSSPTINKHWHLVISVQNLVDYNVLLNKFLRKKATNYILSLESGETGHHHLECFFETIPNKNGRYPEKPDVYRRLIKSLFPEVPDKEWKNMYLKQNKADPDPRFGYGYSLKEGKILASTFDNFEHADFSKYYEEHNERVMKLVSELSVKDEKEIYTPNHMARDCVYFVKRWVNNRKIKRGDSISDIVIEFFRSDIKSKIPWTMYCKINKETLCEYVIDQIVDPLCDEIIDYPSISV